MRRLIHPACADLAPSLTPPRLLGRRLLPQPGREQPPRHPGGPRLRAAGAGTQDLHLRPAAQVLLVVRPREGAFEALVGTGLYRIINPHHAHHSEAQVLWKAACGGSQGHTRAPAFGCDSAGRQAQVHSAWVSCAAHSTKGCWCDLPTARIATVLSASCKPDDLALHFGRFHPARTDRGTHWFLLERLLGSGAVVADGEEAVSGTGLGVVEGLRPEWCLLLMAEMGGG